MAATINTPSNVTLAILKATNFATIKHRNQRRKDPNKTPYIIHPVGVAYSLCSEGNITDTAVIQAALLHDTVEDTDTTLDEIEAEFGKEVRGIVDEVTDDKKMSKVERKMFQIEHAPKKSHKAKLVKLADKLYNLRDLTKVTPEGWSQERRDEYFLWSAHVIKGLLGVNSVLEKELAELLKTKNIDLYSELPPYEAKTL